MSNEIKIEQGIPMPSACDWMFSYESKFRKAIESMNVGDSFVTESQRVSNARYYINKAGHKCITRKLPDGGFRVWKGELK